MLMFSILYCKGGAGEQLSSLHALSSTIVLSHPQKLRL